jgi:hypothetical protein
MLRVGGNFPMGDHPPKIQYQTAGREHCEGLAEKGSGAELRTVAFSKKVKKGLKTVL